MSRSRKPVKRPSFVKRLFSLLIIVLLGGVLLGAFAGYALYSSLESQLPDIGGLREVRYQIPMSVYSRDGKLLAQYGEKKRSPISIADTPKQTIQAFLAAEDDRFFDHFGVDYPGLLRAAFEFMRTGEKRQGGSTITMQVARNFFLSSEKTFFRKIKEIMLAVKIESQLPKQQILELYLNKIYFGHHAYGIDAAAQVYFGKHVGELSLAETAMIAGLPKAPSSFNPIVNPERALTRRDYVLRRMLKLHFIDDDQFKAAQGEPVNASLHASAIELSAPYVAEMVRGEMYQQYGEDAYVNGYKVYTSIDSRLQVAAEKALREALHEYDERHGYRGARQRVDLKKFNSESAWDERLSEVSEIADTVPAIVLTVGEKSAEVYLGKARRARLDWEGVKWARKYLGDEALGPQPRSVKDVLKAGEVVRLRKTDAEAWRLAQIPEVEGALVSLDPENGSIQALVGGFEFAQSKFNRATQAQRQPGSGFKPILYAAALEEGYTPASIINDAPIVFSDPSQEGGEWRPQNYSGKFYGPTRLRVALVKSRNLVSIRLLRDIGVDKAVETALRFGFSRDALPRSLTLALGSGSATPLKMAQAYAVFANGGFRVEPFLIERIQTQEGDTLFQASPFVACAECEENGSKPANLALRVLSPQVHYMMHSMLQDVVRQGTATRAMELGRTDLAGKTGTTNEQRDAWFNGYMPGLVAVSWMGFDSSKPLGEGETGGHTALPMWMYYMREALRDAPERSFPVPEGLTTARIDAATGMLDASGGGIFEVFPVDHVPHGHAAAATVRAEDIFGGESDEDAPAPPLPTSQPPRESAGAPGGKAIESLF